MRRSRRVHTPVSAALLLGSMNTVFFAYHKLADRVGTIFLSSYTWPPMSSGSKPEWTIVLVLAVPESPMRKTIGSLRNLALRPRFEDRSRASASPMTAAISESIGVADAPALGPAGLCFG